jgi:nucleotidyltransferase/DNA polymerase involved in DNA repair
MDDSLASFRDLKGIGPATEARLHETGVYTWEALGAAASALAAIRGNGDTLRDVANTVAARRAEGRASGNGGERLESFVLRMSLTGDGRPQRSQVTHVRTMAEQVWAGWSPAELDAFVQKHAGVRLEPEVRTEPRRRNRPSRTPAATDHVVVLDAGKAIGGVSRDIDLVVTNTRAAKRDFGYRATLASRRLGSGVDGEDWTTVARSAGTGSPERELALEFPAVRLPAGIQRLRLSLEVQLAGPASRPPALELA